MGVITYDTSKRHPAVLAVFFLATALPLYYGSWHYHASHPRQSPAVPTQYNIVWSEDFVHRWLDVHVVEPFNPSIIARYCNTSQWRPNLVFNLDDANGGIGNVRSNTLDFMFYAIEAGASIMLPGRATRSGTDFSNVWDSRAEFDTFFDEGWFLGAMGEACPQMTIYKPQPNDKMVDALPGGYTPRSRRMDKDVGHTKKAYLENLNAFLNGNEKKKEEGETTVINLGRTMWEIDTRSLPDGFRRNMGQLLRINPSMRELAASAVQKLSERHGVKIDPSQPVPRRAFFGAHLRTESDAAHAGWLDTPNSNFSAQTDAYMAHAVKHKLDVIYVATGNETHLAQFKEKAAANNPPLTVTSKFELLEPWEIERLKALTWDQQALVDYEVLQRCSVFGGFVKSSFSYNIAMTRNQWLEDQGRVVDPWYVMHSEDGVAFDDGISRIIGRYANHEERVPRGIWP